MEWKQIPIVTSTTLRAEPIPGLKLTIIGNCCEGFFRLLSGSTVIQREIPTIEEAKKIAIEFVVHQMVNFLREYVEIDQEMEYDPKTDYSEMYMTREWDEMRQRVEEMARFWRSNAR